MTRKGQRIPEARGIETASLAVIERLLRDALAPLQLDLSPRAFEQMATHFSLLLHWNRKINLTALRRPEEIATRHFAESLFLAKLIPFADELGDDLMVDVGSGAGFPGLPLKVAFPKIKTILLEPNKKKAAFLKEVIRSSKLDGIEVRNERLHQAVDDLSGKATLVTLRALKPSPELLADLNRLLAPDGRLALFVGLDDAKEIAADRSFLWKEPVPIPHAERRVILLSRLFSER